MGQGPLLLSTSKELDLPLIHDVNGYYRSLGFIAPYRPSRQALKKAYFERKGQNSAFLTHVAKTLLNKALRAEYNAAPYGEVFYDSWTINRLTEQARAYSMQHGLDYDNMLERMGLVSLSAEELAELHKLQDVHESEYRSCTKDSLDDSVTFTSSWGILVQPGARFTDRQVEAWFTQIQQEHPKRKVILGIVWDGPPTQKYETNTKHITNKTSTSDLTQNVECLLAITREDQLPHY